MAAKQALEAALHPALAKTDHRPWPLPTRPYTWSQSWRDLLFIHWEVDAALLRARIPAGLQLDLFGGRAWIGIVPFDMKGVTRRPFPAQRWCSDFPEINVRTYVTRGGKPGVWFFSLDIPNRPAVWVARRWFHLPYHHAAVSCRREGRTIHYKMREREREFEAFYEPMGRRKFARDSFEIWATERYCLYSQSRGGLLHRGEVHHKPWPLEVARLDIRKNNLLESFAAGPMHPSVLFSERLDVVVWPLLKIDSDSASPAPGRVPPGRQEIDGGEIAHD